MALAWDELAKLRKRELAKQGKIEEEAQPKSISSLVACRKSRRLIRLSPER
jgi:hypothetical protein